jgi:catechol 2,3-dioxygenase-like lactoylglutathione lyase family enzyme
MFTRIDHVGYVVRDLAQGVAAMREPYELQLATELELPRFAIRATLLTGGAATVEVISFTDPVIAQVRLAGQDVRLDHVACEVTDIEQAAARVRASGGRLCGPDGSELDAPLEVGGARHLWTVPAAAPGVCLQLIERLM